MIYAIIALAVLLVAIVVARIVCREPEFRSSHDNQFLNHKRFASSDKFHNYAIVE